MPVGLDWDAMLAEFRALGGTAENVTPRQGSRGRGVFPIDPAKPVRLNVPSNLLVRADDTETRNGQLMAKASAPLGAGERMFFDYYQRTLGWGAGVFDDLWRAQLEWSGLPEQIRDMLPVGGSRFAAPTAELCHKQYVTTRSINYRRSPRIMPLVELINHGSGLGGYEVGDGVLVSGLFDGEVLVDYGIRDCWDMATNHGFCDARDHAYGLRGAFDFEGHRIEISRAFRLAEHVDGCMLPVVRVEGDTIRFPFVTLGNSRFPHLPRLSFRRITRNAPVRRPDELFELIHRYNRLLFLRFLERSEGSPIPLVAMLRGAAHRQLETLAS